MSTYTLIKTDSNFILVSDNPIDMRKPLEVNGEEKISWVHPNVPYHIKDDDYPYEILASLNKIEGLPTLTFDEVVAREIGYVDMLKKCNEIYDMHPNNIELYGDSESKNTYQAGVVDGYLQAKEDNKDKVYTLRDLRNAYEEGLSEGYEREELSYETPMLIDMYADKVRKDKTQWQVEIEMENYSKPEDGHSAVHKDTRPKITNNSINVIAIK